MNPATTTMHGPWTHETIPYICWDRNWTVGEIRQRLQNAEPDERARLMAWLMRELKTNEVWFFTDPEQIKKDVEKIKPHLGQAAGLWEYLLGTWHELGKL